MLLNKSNIESTYKSQDTEEFLDRLFYRPIGYTIAVAAKSVGLTPNAVTFISIIFGVTAGHLFFYQNVTINLIGVLFLITAEALDGADGQLARLTNNYSRYGKIFDGVAGNLMFISIYVNMCIRFIVEGGTFWIFPIALISGASHSFQSAMSEFYRGFYLYFVINKNITIDDLAEVKETFSKLSWIKTPFQKFLLRVYINYTIQQYLLAKAVRKLHQFVSDKFKNNVPQWLGKEYRRLNKPMLKYGNILTTNTRMTVLFIAVFWGNILHYFLFELIVLNLLLIYYVLKEEKIHNYLLELVSKTEGNN